MTAIEIREISAVTPELARSLADLVRQLSSSAKAPTKGELEQIVLSPATVLLAACKSESIVGMLTLVIFRIATGMRGIIEDVVVDEHITDKESPRRWSAKHLPGRECRARERSI